MESKRLTIRISGGLLRGRLIDSPRPGRGVRPTTEKVKLAIFSILGNDEIVDNSVLDLYSCTGAIGIESISRGAKFADFVENKMVNYKLINSNIKNLNIDKFAKVYRDNCLSYLNKINKEYGLIFADPPFELNEWTDLMGLIMENKLLTKGGKLITESSKHVDLCEQYESIKLYDRRTYGDSKISFYEVIND
jgi:16S rRNA (guanine966-N2)-methyltransferase